MSAYSMHLDREIILLIHVMLRVMHVYQMHMFICNNVCVCVCVWEWMFLLESCMGYCHFIIVIRKIPVLIDYMLYLSIFCYSYNTARRFIL